MSCQSLVFRCVCGIAVILPSICAADASHEHPPYKGGPAFEMIKGLQGNWEGTVKEDGAKEDQKASVNYRITSNGSAVVETIFMGTPMEMTSIYFEKDGKLMMTHYCSIGNRPTLALKKETKDSLTFDFKSGENMNVKKDMHIHGLTLEQKPDGSLVQRWEGFVGGKPAPEATVLTLHRAA